MTDVLEVPLAVRVEEWRQKALAKTITPEEMKEAIATIRAGRTSAAIASSRSKASKEVIDPKALSDELEGL